MIAYEFQKAVVDILVAKTMKAVEKFKCWTVVVGGGVAANQFLRDEVFKMASQNEMQVWFPPKELSVDNGAMIAAAAFFNFKKQKFDKVVAQPNLYFS